MNEPLDIPETLTQKIEEAVAKFPNKCLGYKGQYNKQYYQEHKERLRQHQRDKYHSNIEQTRAYFQEWRAKRKQQKEEG